MEKEHKWLGQYVLDEQGNPVPETNLFKWAAWMEVGNRRVDLARFPWGGVSTVFLGLDHSFELDPMRDPLTYKPVLWETMVFGGKMDGEQRRYRSREEALEGHREIVEECKSRG